MQALDMWTHPSATRMPIPMGVRPKRNWSGACHTSFNMTLGFLGWDGKGFWKGKVNKFNANDCFQVATVVVLIVSLRERIQILAQAYYAKLLVLPWNQSWDYSFESLPMLTVLEDSIALGQTAKGRLKRKPALCTTRCK